MIKKLNNRKAVILLLALFYIALIVAFSQRAEAAVTGQETSINLFGANDTRVGRYRLNYTGNTNHYAFWGTDGTEVIKRVFNDLGGSYANSSVAALNRLTSTSTIKYAYLVWETRSSQGPTTPVVLVTPNGRAGYVHPDYAINDWREDTVNHSWAYQSLYCMAVDVTAIVQSAGYGNYAVCNIPRYEENGSYTAGESPGSWQLIVVEEDDNFPVSAVKLDMGARFYMGKDFGSQLTLGNGLKSKSVGATTGQVFFGASNSGLNVAMIENVSTYNSIGWRLGQVVSNTTYSPGLYKNGMLVNGRDYGNGCIRMDLSDITSNMGNSVNRIDLTIQNTGWTTSFLLGMAVDIAYPDFSGTQTTTVNSSDSVTVTGSFTNTAATVNTGIYNGNLVITLDSALSAQSASAVVNGTTTIDPTSISGNQVVFGGAAVASMMNGSTISYTVQCSANNSGKTVFYNDAGFHGYLCSDGVNTGYWIDRMWTAESDAVPKYTVSVLTGNGIESVSGGGEYPYGSTVTINAAVLQGHHWLGWNEGSFAATQEYSFSMPNRDITVRADAKANTYTIVFEPNGGAEVTHIEDITAQYDMEITLPDGAAAYKKYTLDGVNVTPDVLSGLLSPNSVPETQEAEESLPEDEISPEDSETVAVSQSEETELTTEPEEGQSDKAVYESVYKGWALEEEKDYFEPQLEPGAVSVAQIAEMAGVTNQNGAVIKLYAVWDDCPWIDAHTLYYTLGQAQSGFITAGEILSHATASDREDGSPIVPGFHENGTSFSILDYAPTDFTQFTDTGACTENLTVVDSSGSVYVKRIWVWVVNTEAETVKAEGTTRFINEYYYNQPYELGGLADDSLWKTDPEYVRVITEAFENLKNDTPVESYYFTHEENLEMREYIEEHGFGNSKEPDALRNFYDRFMASNRVE